MAKDHPRQLHALIILSGTLPPATQLAPELARADLIIAADGGANLAAGAGLRVDAVVGDLDSVTPATRKQLAGVPFLLRPSQEQTDIEKTLDYVLERGAGSATLCAISGGRFDHQINNLNMMQKYTDRLELSCFDASGWGRFITGSFRFQAQPGQQISLIAFKKATGIRTRGLKYPIENGTLEWGVSSGQSNEAGATEVEISIAEGSLFLWSAEAMLQPSSHPGP